MHARRVVYAVNPSAGLGASGDLGRRFSADARVPDLEVVLVAEASFAALRARASAALRQGADALVVQGGDGMVSLGAALVAGTDVALGVVPAGSGNDFARAAGLRRGAPTASIAELLGSLRTATAAVRAVDAMRVTLDGTQHVAINSVNLGFDALVNRRANELRRLPGTLRYLAALVSSVRDFEPIDFRVALDSARGDLLHCPGELLTILNGSSIGGGIRVAPEARLDDGALDVLRVSGLGRLGLLTLFPLAIAGLHTRLPAVSLERATSIRVQVPEGVLVYADGEELRGPDARGAASLSVTVDPGAVRLIVPRRS